MRVLTACLVLGVVAPPPPPEANSSSSGCSWREAALSCLEQAMHVSIGSDFRSSERECEEEFKKGERSLVGLINGDAH